MAVLFSKPTQAQPLAVPAVWSGIAHVAHQSLVKAGCKGSSLSLLSGLVSLRKYNVMLAPACMGVEELQPHMCQLQAHRLDSFSYMPQNEALALRQNILPHYAQSSLLISMMSLESTVSMQRYTICTSCKQYNDKTLPFCTHICTEYQTVTNRIRVHHLAAALPKYLRGPRMCLNISHSHTVQSASPTPVLGHPGSCAVTRSLLPPSVRRHAPESQRHVSSDL